MAINLDNNKPINLRQAFLLPTSDNPTSYGSMTKRRTANSAAFKFTNSSVGGNFCINPLPQYTRYADIRQAGRGRPWSKRFQGMGRYYSEAHDDTKQEVIMSFGVPKFSSWTSFFTNFYDRSAAGLANRGVTSKAWYNLGLGTGYFITLPIQPFLLGVTGASRVYNFLQRNQPSKWFYFQPNMHSYWSSVNTLANQLAVSMGLVPRIYGKGQEGMDDPGQSVDPSVMKEFNRLMPGLFREDGGFDIMSIATRAQRMSDKARVAEEQLLSRAQTIKDLRAAIEQVANTSVDGHDKPVDSKQYFTDTLTALGGTEEYGEDVLDASSFNQWSDLSDWYEFMTAHQRDATQWISIRAEYNGEVSESFSNTTRDVGVASTLNAKVNEGKAARFNFMEGNVAEPIGAITDMIGKVVSGALDSVNLAGLETLTGTAFIDVPEHWEDSMANLPSATYTVKLECPYGNDLSRFLFMMVPISMLLPMVLPRATGRSSYTSPFLCQLFHKGRVQRQLGICTDFSIRRGTGNVGWNAEHKMLNCEISFTIKDLNKIMYMPIKAGFASDNWFGTATRAAGMMVGEAAGGEAGAGIAAAAMDGAVWDEQSLFQDYISSLTSMSWSELFYIGRRLNYNITKSVNEFNRWRSPSNFMSWSLDTTVPRMLSAFAATTDRFQ